MAASTSATLPASEYDFIVVGGGTSGLVVAARLTEDPNVQVLVLEAGQDHLADPRVNIPAMWAATLGSELDWQFVTTPQVIQFLELSSGMSLTRLHFQDGLKSRTIRHPQGRALGGSSAINNQAYIAPSEAGINAWAKLGNPHWDWSTLASYYRKFNTLTLPDKETQDHLGLDWVDEQVRGTSGPIQASFAGVIQDPLAKAWVDTFKSLDHGVTGDPYSGKATGGYSNPSTVDPTSKTRSYAASAYYAPVSKRTNLHVVTGALVSKILLENTEDGVTARGVLVTLHDNAQEVHARMEVILAAGAFQSPKLLELSGIGDSSLLESHGIPLIINNPNVGENLQDHLMTGISYEVKEGVFTGDALMRQEPEAIQGAMQLYTEHKVGPFCVGGIGSHAFMPMVDFLAEDGKKELQLLLEKHSPNAKEELQYDLIRSIIESADEGSGALFMFLAQVNLHASPDAKDFVQNLQPGSFLSLGATQAHPFSRGGVHVSSADATQAPIIDPRYFSHPLDVEILSRHVQILEKLAETQPLASFLKPDGRRNHPTAYVKNLDAAKDYTQSTAFSNYHPSGTCAMMAKEHGGVVDERLLVYGTNNLRIVDSSIMPLIPRGNIQSTVYAVAERAADIIKEDGQSKSQVKDSTE